MKAIVARSLFGGELLLRVLTSILGIGLITVSIIAGPFYVKLLITLAASMSLWEWGAFLKQKTLRFLASLGGLSSFLGAELASFLILLSLVSLFLGIGFEKQAPWKDKSIRLGALFYILLSFTAMAQISQNKEAFLFMLLITWATDSGAYFVGRWLGGALLAPSISPKKTWSGFVGGMVAALGIISIFLVIKGELSFYLISIGLILAAVVQGGDLLESLYKRYLKVKDMGNCLPGHGGLLDRLDGLMAASIVMLLFFIGNF